MSILAFKEWVSGLPEIASLNKYIGHWLNYEGSNAKEYMSIMVTGGSNPREVDTEYSIVQVALVGTKGSTADNILAIATAMREYSKQIPPQCGIVAVNALGAIRGPIKSEGARQVVNLSFEIIT